MSDLWGRKILIFCWVISWSHRHTLKRWEFKRKEVYNRRQCRRRGFMEYFRFFVILQQKQKQRQQASFLNNQPSEMWGTLLRCDGIFRIRLFSFSFFSSARRDTSPYHNDDNNNNIEYIQYDNKNFLYLHEVFFSLSCYQSQLSLAWTISIKSFNSSLFLSSYFCIYLFSCNFIYHPTRKVIQVQLVLAT